MNEATVGLSSQAADQIRLEVGLNRLEKASEQSTWRIIRSILTEPMIALLIVGGILYLIIGDLAEAVMMWVMIFFVSGITFIQEKRTGKALQALADLAAPKALVMRDGEYRLLPAEMVVPGDVIKLQAGDRVPADATIITTENMAADESMLTGESFPVVKNDHDSIYSGTLIVSGIATATITEIGTGTKMGRIGQSLNSVTELPTKMQQEIRQVTLIMAIAGVLLALVVVIYFAVNQELLTGLLNGIAIAMSLLPEEFPLVLTIFLALGAYHMTKHHVLIRHLPVIETLGSITVLCTDKTGTLTQNRLVVTAVSDESNQAGIIAAAVKTLPDDSNDPLDIAIREAAEPLELTHPLKRIRHYPYTQLSSMSASAYRLTASSTAVYVKGAPEKILEHCKLPKHNLSQLKQQLHTLSSQGMRVISVAKGVYSSLPENLEGLSFEWVGLIGFSDPLKSTAKAAIQACYAAGIRVMMITGDLPNTAKSIATALGLPTETVVHGEDIADLSAKELAQKLKSTSICARVQPEQKLAIVRSLQQAGEVVAMTGDGVNDSPALKAAECGIAMGDRGCDVAREAADIILMDDNFGTIVEGIFYGREIYTTITKALGYVVAVHLPIAMLSIVPLLFGWPMIVNPILIVLMEMVIDPACTIVFQSQSPSPLVKQCPPRPPAQKLFSLSFLITYGSMGFVAAGGLLGLYGLLLNSGTELNTVRTITFLSLIFANLTLIRLVHTDHPSFVIREKPPRTFMVLTGVILLLLLLCVSIPALGQFTTLVPVRPTELIYPFLFIAGLFTMLDSARLIRYNRRRYGR